PRRGGQPPARDDRRRARAARAVAGDPAGRCVVARGPSSLARRDVDRVPRPAHRRARRGARGPDRRRRWSVSDRTATFERILAPEPGRTALLVVDMQRGFVEPGEAMEVPPARASVPVIRALVDLFRSRRLPVVFTAFVYSPDVPLLVGELHPEHKPAAPGAPRGFGMPSSSCLAGSPSARVVEALAPRPDEPVIDKRWYDAFAGSALDGALRARGVTSLVVTGTMTDVCVLATVIGAFNREYRVTVVEDGVTTLWPEIQRATLDIVARAYGRGLADTPGVTGIVANGHAAEVASLSREERTRTLAVALDEVAGACPIVAGVYTDGTAEAVELAKDAQTAGAAGVLLFPPTLFMWGAQVKPDMVIRHYSDVAAVGLPIVAFEYPPA